MVLGCKLTYNADKIWLGIGEQFESPFIDNEPARPPSWAWPSSRQSVGVCIVMCRLLDLDCCCFDNDDDDFALLVVVDSRSDTAVDD